MSNFVLQIIAEVENTPPGTMSIKDFVWILPVAFLGIFLLVKTWGRVARSKAHSDLSVQERIGRQSKRRDVYYDQMSELMAALADLSRQINGQIDTRLAKLEILLRQADEKIEMMNQQKVSAKKFSSKKPGKEIKDIAEQFHQSVPPEKPANEENLSPQAREILQMFSQGISKIDIAQKLDRPVGEIELILSLAGKKAK